MKAHNGYLKNQSKQMKYTPKIFILIIIICTSCRYKNKEEAPYPIQDKDIQLLYGIQHLKNDLTNLDDSKIMVIAHRGDWRNAPENSLQAIQNCINMGVDMVEVDVRPTKDGVLVLMHDEKIDRTTTGIGYVSDWSLDSLKTLYLKNGANHTTHHKIPTLKEAMLVAKGKILVNLDKCYNNFDKAYKVLKETETIDHVIIKGKVSFNQVEKEFGNYLDKVHFMPIVDLGDKNAEEIIYQYRKKFKPLAYELVFKNEDSPILNKLEDIKKDGSKVWVNSLWESLNAGYEDDMALINPDSIYGWYIEKGIDMIQTDRPQLLLEYLRKKRLHN